jgi:hypothetical protein
VCNTSTTSDKTPPIQPATTGLRFTGDVKRSLLPPPVVGDTEYQIDKSPCKLPIVGVTTTLRLESTCLQQTLASMPIVVVLDAGAGVVGTDTVPNLHVLDLERQRHLYPDLSDAIPMQNYARKNIGYVYAIDKMNACAIWDFDDDNCLTDAATSLLLSAHSKPLLASFQVQGTSGVVNPYLLYGSSEFIWPRGYPLQTVSTARTEFPTATRSTSENGLKVIQVMQGVDPDVDAIWRLQYGAGHLPMEWSSPDSLRHQDTLVGLAPDSWAPFNAQATLIKADAVPFAFLPCGVNGRVSDIWRAYMMEYLLGTDVVGFSGAFVAHYRNQHDYTADFVAEQQLYEQSERLVQYLRQRPMDNSGLFGLVNDLYARGYLHECDVATVSKWISLGWGKELPWKKTEPTPPIPKAPRNIVAVVHINSMMRSLAPIWMALHGHLFASVEIYVPRSAGCKPISGIPIHCVSGDQRGHMAYESMVDAMERTYLWEAYNPPNLPFAISLGEDTNTHLYSEDLAMDSTRDPIPDNPQAKSHVAGFLFMHDDIVWHRDLLTTLANSQQNAVVGHRPFARDTNDWIWTNLYVGWPAVDRFLQRYMQSRAAPAMFLGMSDFFYVTKAETPRFARLAKNMIHSGVFLEVAIPSLLRTFMSEPNSHYPAPQNANVFRVVAREDMENGCLERQECDVVHLVKMWSSINGILSHIIHA